MTVRPGRAARRVARRSGEGLVRGPDLPARSSNTLSASQRKCACSIGAKRNRPRYIMAAATSERSSQPDRSARKLPAITATTPGNYRSQSRRSRESCPTTFQRAVPRPPPFRPGRSTRAPSDDVEPPCPSPTCRRQTRCAPPNEAPGLAALGIAIDEMSEKLGMNPIEFRIANDTQVVPDNPAKAPSRRRRSTRRSTTRIRRSPSASWCSASDSAQSASGGPSESATRTGSRWSVAVGIGVASASRGAPVTNSGAACDSTREIASWSRPT